MDEYYMKDKRYTDRYSGTFSTGDPDGTRIHNLRIKYEATQNKELQTQKKQSVSLYANEQKKVDNIETMTTNIPGITQTTTNIIGPKSWPRGSFKNSTAVIHVQIIITERG